ncbi:hypothetical protein ISCGN_008166 [Ixodes scapularis]
MEVCVQAFKGGSRTCVESDLVRVFLRQQLRWSRRSCCHSNPCTPSYLSAKHMYDETVRSDVRPRNMTVGGEGFQRSPMLRKPSPLKVIPAVRTSDRTVSSYMCFAL